MVLVDTSSWIEALRQRGDVDVRERVRALLVTGEAAWCEMVRLELWNGARGTAEQRTLREFERDLPLLSITPEVWQRADQLARQARASGLTVPATDLLIVACARHHGVAVEHCDAHLEALQQLREP